MSYWLKQVTWLRPVSETALQNVVAKGVDKGKGEESVPCLQSTGGMAHAPTRSQCLWQPSKSKFFPWSTLPASPAKGAFLQDGSLSSFKGITGMSAVPEQGIFSILLLCKLTALNRAWQRMVEWKLHCELYTSNQGFSLLWGHCMLWRKGLRFEEKPTLVRIRASSFTTEWSWANYPVFLGLSFLQWKSFGVTS